LHMAGERDLPGVTPADRNSARSAGISTEDLYRQDYEKQQLPDGVYKMKANVFFDEYGGHFFEISRLEFAHVEALDHQAGIDLPVRQINTACIKSGTTRFGHIHPNQNELWTITDGTLTLVLCDRRVKSSTVGVKSAIVLHTGDQVYIPAGVAHGFINSTPDSAQLVYLASEQFSAGEKTEEWRFIPLAEDWWEFAKPKKY
jgi:dTDP-4-dehydrorhamnose 3,5-epimerase-like enzyme